MNTGPTSQSPTAPYFADLAAACDALLGTSPKDAAPTMLSITTNRAIDALKHFVVRATGHRDIDVGSSKHTILMVTLRKAGQSNVEHRYADRFTSPRSLEWDSQASTYPESAKGQRIIRHQAEGRTIHLFIQYDAHSPFTYCGPLVYQSHEGARPMHVKFALTCPLPETLWKLWGAR